MKGDVDLPVGCYFSLKLYLIFQWIVFMLFFLNNIFLCQKIFTSILFCNNCQRPSWKAIFFFRWLVHPMHRESRCVGKPPVLKPCVAFKRVKHNASWVQRCMLRAWQAEEIQTREFSVSAVSLLNIADCWHKPSDMSNSWIILFVYTWIHSHSKHLKL